jgi:hypothetical protein
MIEHRDDVKLAESTHAEWRWLNGHELIGHVTASTASQDAEKQAP